MNQLPMYKQMQGRKPLDEEFRQQDAVFQFYNEHGIVNGVPGTVTEQEIDSKRDAIVESSLPQEVKLSALEMLDVHAQNNLEFGNASNSIEGIHRAWENVFYGGLNEIEAG